MKQLSLNDFSIGFPTKHRIRFKSLRSTVEGISAGGNEDSEQVYEGVLFETNHFGSHLCVLVDRNPDWPRKGDWHGYVSRNNVVSIVLSVERSKLSDGEQPSLLVDRSFLFAWGMFVDDVVSN